MHWCAIIGCDNNSKNTVGLSFFSLPKDERFTKWVKFCKAGISLKSATVCSLHFRARDFRCHRKKPFKTRRGSLKKTAIPSYKLRDKKESENAMINNKSKTMLEPKKKSNCTVKGFKRGRTKKELNTSVKGIVSRRSEEVDMSSDDELEFVAEPQKELNLSQDLTLNERVTESSTDKTEGSESKAESNASKNTLFKDKIICSDNKFEPKKKKFNKSRKLNKSKSIIFEKICFNNELETNLGSKELDSTSKVNGAILEMVSNSDLNDLEKSELKKNSNISKNRTELETISQPQNEVNESQNLVFKEKVSTHFNELEKSEPKKNSNIKILNEIIIYSGEKLVTTFEPSLNTPENIEFEQMICSKDELEKSELKKNSNISENEISEEIIIDSDEELETVSKKPQNEFNESQNTFNKKISNHFVDKLEELESKKNPNIKILKEIIIYSGEKLVTTFEPSLNRPENIEFEQMICSKDELEKSELKKNSNLSENEISEEIIIDSDEELETVSKKPQNEFNESQNTFNKKISNHFVDKLEKLESKKNPNPLNSEILEDLVIYSDEELDLTSEPKANFSFNTSKDTENTSKDTEKMICSDDKSEELEPKKKSRLNRSKSIEIDYVIRFNDELEISQSKKNFNISGNEVSETIVIDSDEELETVSKPQNEFNESQNTKKNLNPLNSEILEDLVMYSDGELHTISEPKKDLSFNTLKSTPIEKVICSDDKLETLKPKEKSNLLEDTMPEEVFMCINDELEPILEPQNELNPDEDTVFEEIYSNDEAESKQEPNTALEDVNNQSINKQFENVSETINELNTPSVICPSDNLLLGSKDSDVLKHTVNVECQTEDTVERETLTNLKWKVMHLTRDVDELRNVLRDKKKIIKKIRSRGKKSNKKSKHVKIKSLIF